MKWLIEKFREFDKRPAIIDKGQIYTYSDLYAEIQFKIRNFQVKKIDSIRVVALSGKFSFHLIAAFFALVDSDHVVAILAENDAERSIKINLLEPDVLVKIKEDKTNISILTDSVRKDKLHPLIKTGHSGMVIFTSGTTGKPKAILHDLDIIFDKYKRNYSKDLNCLPLMGIDHIGGFDILLSQLGIGATITIPDEITPQSIADTIARYKVNVISTTPTFLNLLMLSEAYKEYDLSSLSIIGYGSEPMPEWLLKNLNNVFPWVSFQQKYGISETNAIRIKSKSDDSLYFTIDDPQVEFQIVDSELWIKSPYIFQGYLGEHESDACIEWYRTGDIVEKDDEGYLRILGRKSDIINVGGEKVFPAEVEAIILELPFIKDCRIYAEKNPIIGNIVVADISPTSSFDLNNQKTMIRKYLLERLERYKVPVKINFVESIEYSARLKKKRLPL